MMDANTPSQDICCQFTHVCLILTETIVSQLNCDRAKTKIQKGKKNTDSQSSKHSWIPKNCFCKPQQVAMVTKPKAKFVFSDDIFLISSHRALRISSFFVYMKFCAKPHLVLNQGNSSVLRRFLQIYIKFSHRNYLAKGYLGYLYLFGVAPPPCMKLFEVPPGIRCLKEQINENIYLLLNLSRCVSKEYRRSWITGTHFCFSTLKGWKECGKYQRRFWATQPWSNITSHSEVWILKK